MVLELLKVLYIGKILLLLTMDLMIILTVSGVFSSPWLLLDMGIIILRLLLVDLCVFVLPSVELLLVHCLLFPCLPI